MAPPNQLSAHANKPVLQAVPDPHAPKKEGTLGLDQASIANKRLKVTETSFTHTTSRNVSEERIYLHKVVNSVSNDKADNTAPAGNADAGNADADQLDPLILAAITHTVKNCFAAQRVTFRNDMGARSRNRTAGVLQSLPAIERSYNLGGDRIPFEADLGLDLTRLYTQDMIRQGFTEAQINQIQAVYRDDSLHEDFGLALRRENLVKFFFGREP